MSPVDTSRKRSVHSREFTLPHKVTDRTRDVAAVRHSLEAVGGQVEVGRHVRSRSREPALRRVWGLDSCSRWSGCNPGEPDLDVHVEPPWLASGLFLDFLNPSSA